MQTNDEKPINDEEPTKKKYFYISRVGLTKDSWALKKFDEDAVRHHMVDQPSKLAALRLTEYYELLARLNAVPNAIVFTSAPATTNNGDGRSVAKIEYFYINRVGLTNGSWALKKFDEDAKQHHMVDQPGKLAALRLTEYYDLIERLSALPGAIMSVLAEVQTTNNGNGNGRGVATMDHRWSSQEDTNQGGSQETAIEEQPDDSFDDEVDDQWDNMEEG